MSELFSSAVFSGAALTMAAYFAGVWIKNKTGNQFFNPILIAIVTIIVFLVVTDMDYDTYNYSAQYISWFLTPATVSLAIPLYRQLNRLKTNAKAILLGILSGVIASGVSQGRSGHAQHAQGQNQGKQLLHGIRSFR